MVSCSDMTVSAGYTYDTYPYNTYYYYHSPIYYYRPYYYRPYYYRLYRPVYRERIIIVPQRNNFRQRNNSGTFGHFGGRR